LTGETACAADAPTSAHAAAHASAVMSPLDTVCPL
jgi:hypothetical protein